MDHQQPPAVPEPSSVLCSVAVDWRGSLHANNNLRKETISTCAPKSYVLSCSFQWLLDRTVEMKIALLSLPCSSDTLPTFTPLKTKQQCYSHTLSNEVYSNLKFLCRSKDLSLMLCLKNGDITASSFGLSFFSLCRLSTKSATRIIS